MKKNILNLFYVSLFLNLSLSPVSVVYNLRIAETTKRPNVENDARLPSIFGLVTIGQWRETYAGRHQAIAAELGTLMYSTKNWYIRADFAGGYVRESGENFCFSRHQTDDFLFSTGFSKNVRKNIRVTLSGLVGIPTHKPTGLKGIEFGTGHYSAGVQLDGMYRYSQKHALMTATRLVHFFNRTELSDILGRPLCFDVDLGDLFDILISHQSVWNKHKFEFGYNPAFVFNPRICPPLPIESPDHFIRNSFYASYAYRFLIKHHFSAIITGFSYGFDQTKTLLTLKNSVNAWFAWGINF